MPFIVLPGGGDVVIIGHKTLREKLGIDVMTQLKASVLKAHGRVDGPEMEATAGAVDEPNAGARILRWRCRTVWARWGRRLMTLLTMTYRQNVPRCCPISYFARALTYSVGRCWANRLRAWSP